MTDAIGIKNIIVTSIIHEMVLLYCDKSLVVPLLQ